MRRFPYLRQQSLHTIERRVGASFRRWILRSFVPTPAVNLVRVGGKSYKRITFIDAWRTHILSEVLEEYRDDGIFPAVVARFENELMVDYVEGEPQTVLDESNLDALARFFGALYRRGARRVPTAETRFAAALERDLVFLREAGVLGDRMCDALLSKLPSLTPAVVWVGTEYVDALPRNFVKTPQGELVAIDVDGVHRDELVGVGVAKALRDASPPQRDRFCRALQETGAPDLGPVMPFVDLCFLAGWKKLLFLKGRSRRIDSTRFEALLPPGSR